jgi:predicted Zn-dependent peptidase
MEVKRGKVEQLEGTLERAESLGENAIFYNDPGVINTASDKLMSVTKEQIQKAAQTYLIDTNRTVVTTIPKPRAGGAQ